MSEVWQTVLGIIASVGGAGGIIWTLAKGIARRTADILAAKIQAENQAEIDRKIEEWKSELESRGYISKTRFDTEFAIYKELCSAFFAMNGAIHLLFPDGFDGAPASKNWKEICGERYKDAKEKYAQAISLLGSNAPFIGKDIYNKFYELIRLSALQIHDYAFSEPDALYKSADSIRKIANEGYQRTKEIDEKWNALLDELRSYFESLTQEGISNG